MPEPGHTGRVLGYDASMSKKPKIETKTVTLNISKKKDAKELVKLTQDGWVVISEHKRGIMEWKPLQVDFVLTRTKVLA